MFELKEAETSNSLLLVKNLLQGDQCKELKNSSNGDCETPTEDMEQDLDSDKENKAHKVTVVKTFYHYLEMKPTKPGYQKLSQLLESRIMKNFDRYVLCTYVVESFLISNLYNPLDMGLPKSCGKINGHFTPLSIMEEIIF